MAIINSLENTAKTVIDGVETLTNKVTTLLALPPVLLKTADKLLAKIGDTVKYTITIENVNLSALANVNFVDALPNGCSYVAGTFKINATTATPVITGNTISYNIANIAILGTVTITFDVKVTGSAEV